MKVLLFFALFLSVFSCTAAQTPTPSPTPENISKKETQTTFSDYGVKNPPIGATLRPAYTRPDSKTRLKRYLNGTFGLVALGKTVLSAGYSTWRNSPEEWGATWKGFGRRFASGLGNNAIKGTTTYVLDEAFKLDSGFYRSTKKDFGGRLGDALLSTFVARKPDGKKVFGFPRIAGTYTASVIAAETWYPKRFTYKDGLKNGTISLGLNAAFNVIKEFVLKK